MIPAGHQRQNPVVIRGLPSGTNAGQQQQQSLEDLPAYGIVEELAAPYARHRTFAAPSGSPPRPDQNPVHLFTNSFYHQNPPAPASSNAAGPPPPHQRIPAPHRRPTGLQRPQEAFTGNVSQGAEPDYGLVAELRGHNAAETLVPGFGMAAEVTRMRQAQMLLPQPGTAQGRPRGERTRLAPVVFQPEDIPGQF